MSDIQLYKMFENSVSLRVAPRLQDTDLWTLAEQGLLYRCFSEADNYLDEFFREVNAVVAKKEYRDNSERLSGRWLYFDPPTSMYDGFASTFSNGFFDKDDVPPPEVWVGCDKDKLVCFVPEQFVEQAESGIEQHISGSLEWA